MAVSTPRRLRYRGGVAPPPRSPRGHAADRADAARRRRSPASPPPINGPFVVQSRSPQETVFTANRQYFAAAGGPAEGNRRTPLSHHRPSHRGPEAGRHPSARPRQSLDLPSLRADPASGRSALRLAAGPLPDSQPSPAVDVAIGPSAGRSPTEFTARRFSQQMLGGSRRCPVASSPAVPFPWASSAGDPMGYASDESIEPRPYEPRLAIALANVTL